MLPAVRRDAIPSRRLRALADLSEPALAAGSVPATRAAAAEPAVERVAEGPPAVPSPRPAPSGRFPLSGGEEEFHPHTLALDDHPISPIRGLVVAAILILVAVVVVWSFVSHVSSFTSAPGKVQTMGRTKVLEALTTGRVVKILKRDGDSVKAGEPLVELDPTAALATRTALAQQLADLRGETLRAQTEIKASRADPVDPRTQVPWTKDTPDTVRTREGAVARADLEKLAAQLATLAAKKQAKQAERDRYAKDIEAQKALVAVTQENLTMIETLMKSGFNSQAKYLDMKATLDGQQVQQTSYEGSLDAARQAILIVDSEIAKAHEVFVAERTQTISNDQQTIVDLAQQLVKADVTLANMTLRAQVSGVVHAAEVTTVGQVVKPGQQLLQIVPSDMPLEIEAYIPNSQIGFIRKGDPANIKVDAFNFNVYGSIDGTVTDVGGDALAVQGKPTVQSSSLDGEYSTLTAAQKTGNLQYPVHIRAAKSTMLVEGKEIPLVPGMLVTVEIETENLRAIDYVLTPIEELFSTAGHER